MTENYNERMRQSSHLAGTNSAYVEAMYESYLADPNSVSAQWRAHFNQLPHVVMAHINVLGTGVIHSVLCKSLGTHVVLTDQRWFVNNHTK